MKIRWLIDMPGMTHGVWGQKAGDVQELSTENAESYIASGIATDELKGPLPKAYQETEKVVALRERVIQRFAEAYRKSDVAQQFAPRPGSEPVGRHPGFPRQRVDGWGV